MKLKSYILLGLAGLLLLFGVYYVSSRAYITVNIQGAPQDGEFRYTLYNQDTQEATTVKSTSPQLKRLLPTGAYEVTVQHESGSFFTVVDNGRFFGTTNVEAGMTGEKARSFVGNNPKSCMQLAEGVLLSIPCGDTVTKLQIHQPASATLGTFTTKSISPLEGFVESMFTLNNTPYALIKSPDISEDQGAPHTLYVLTKDGNLTAGKTMPGLSSSQTYAAEPYRQGLLVYSLDGSELFYYPVIGGQPVKLSIGKPKTEGLTFNTLSVSRESILLTYSANEVRQIPGSRVLTDEEILPGGEDTEAAKTDSEVVVFSDGQTTNYPLKGTIDSARLCGSDKLCVLDNGIIQVYATAGGELEPLFAVSGVDSIDASPGGLLVIRNDGILNLDVETRLGSLEYSFGTYQFCGVRQAATGYTVCVTNTKGTDVALQINQDAADTDAIDKKVAKLLDSSAVKDVSMYGTSIFISPNVGELVYNPDINGYTYSPEAKKSAADAIGRAVSELQIDTARYRVLSTIQ